MHFHFRKKAMSLLRVNHRWFALVVFFSVFCLGLLVGKPVLASWLDPFWNLIGSGLLMLIKLLGKLLVVVIDILIKVAGYDNFIESAAVVKGWIVLRDTCNMFFIVILLISAFYTVLSIEKYSYKRLLPTLLIMAVLINFSKTIAGFFIDMAQVAMMTFVNGFKSAAAGNLTTAFGLQDLLKYRNDVKELDVSDTVISLIMALVMLLIAVLVTGVIVVVFIVRIIALWILVVVSPIAYLAHASPGGQKYSSMWWSNFGKYVTIGPILAFFLWLSLAVMGDPNDLEAMKKMGESSESLSEEARSAIAVSASKATSSENMLGFAISIAMLMGALMAAQQLGGVAGSLAGKMSGRIAGGFGTFALAKKGALKGVRAGARAGFEATRVPALAKGIGMAVTRTELGRRYLTKEGRAEAKTLRDAKMAERFGAKGEVRAAKDRAARERAEALDKSGAFVNANVAASTFESLMEKNDDVGARAMLRKMAEKGWIKEGQLRDYGKKFEKGGDIATRSGRNFADFSIELAQLAKKEGIHKSQISDYKYDAGKLVYLGEVQKTNKLQSDVEEYSIGDVRTKVDKDAVDTSINVETGEANNRMAGAIVLALAKHSDEFGRLSQGQRDMYAKAAERVFVDADKFGIDKNDKARMEKIQKVRDFAKSEYDHQGNRTNTDDRSINSADEDKIRRERDAELLEDRRKLMEAGIGYKPTFITGRDKNQNAINEGTSQMIHKRKGMEVGEGDLDSLSGAKDTVRSINEDRKEVANASSDFITVFHSFEKFIKHLEAAASQLDIQTNNKSGQVDENGIEMSNMEVLKKSKMYQDALNARELAKEESSNLGSLALDPKVTDDKYKEEVEKAKKDIENMARNLSIQLQRDFSIRSISAGLEGGDLRQRREWTHRRVKGKTQVGYQETSDLVEATKKETDAREKQLKNSQACHSAISILRRAERSGTISDNILLGKIQALRSEFETQRKNKVIANAELDKLLKALNEVKESL